MFLTADQGATWTQKQKLAASDGGTDDEFGWSVAIDGNIIAIGAGYDDDTASNSGASYL